MRIISLHLSLHSPHRYTTFSQSRRHTLSGFRELAKGSLDPTDYGEICPEMTTRKHSQNSFKQGFC